MPKPVEATPIGALEPVPPCLPAFVRDPAIPPGVGVVIAGVDIPCVFLTTRI